jgi:hypothetical protein
MSRDRHVVIRRDVQAVEFPAAGVEHRPLAVRADLIDEDEPSVAGQHQMVSVEADIRLTVAADRPVLLKRVHHRGFSAGHIELFDLVLADVEQDIRVPAGPAWLAHRGDLEGEVLDEVPLAVVQREVAQMQQEELGAVLVEGAHR